MRSQQQFMLPCSTWTPKLDIAIPSYTLPSEESEGLPSIITTDVSIPSEHKIYG